ncbi:NERD domain-containing protein [Peribacillus muralis]|uniref:NERD domain-containing protein n=1 Tax=Peribacillus muralis TaxID=264697 RepID=UPI001F4E99C9|nr:NERD domain-containing protein [Peribacillus muralis]MCK1991902.1 NERD domain-containing protein [Peribacillus muralis]MCK2012460.1 NERD domain-containing protein [Peribacillus muralis]
MAQLIKMQDYISRYEQDIYRYPTQYARLKKQQWDKLKAAYHAGELDRLYSEQSVEDTQVKMEPVQDESKGLMKKVKGIFHRTGKQETEAEELVMANEVENPNIFSLRFPFHPANLDELKQNYLNQLLRFQMKWGSSTLREKSFVDRSFFLDERLRFFLQRFPDTFLVLYKPIFLLKNAAVEVDVIVLTPVDAWCITFLEAEEDAAFIGSGDRFWTRRHHRHPDKKVLNPLLSANRMGNIVSQLFSLYEVNIPIKKAILSRNGYVDYPEAPYDTTVLDKRTFPEWFERMRNTSSPIKAQQLKAAQALLEYCQTTSSMRSEWVADELQTKANEHAEP